MNLDMEIETLRLKDLIVLNHVNRDKDICKHGSINPATNKCRDCWQEMSVCNHTPHCSDVMLSITDKGKEEYKRLAQQYDCKDLGWWESVGLRLEKGSDMMFAALEALIKSESEYELEELA